MANLDPVFALLLAILSDFRELAISFKISCLGFSFTLWHLWISCTVISIVVPLLFKLTVSSPFASVFRSVGSSERNDDKK